MTLDEERDWWGAHLVRFDGRLRVGIRDGSRSATGVTPPSRGLWLRALLLERERVGQHLWDLSFLGNDAGLAFGLAQFSRLREDWLRVSHALFGHRYLMDAVIPGGVARDIDEDGIARIHAEAETWAKPWCCSGAFPIGTPVSRTASSVADASNPISRRAAGLIGFAGRASAVAWDLRVLVSAGAMRQARRQHGDARQRRRGGARHGSLRRDRRIAATDRRDIVEAAGGRHRRAHPAGARATLALGWVEGSAAKCWSRSKPALATASAVCIRTIRRGTTGRCSSGRCSATSFRIFRSSTSRSTCHTAAMICNLVPAS